MSINPKKATLNPVKSFILASGSPRRKELLGQLFEGFKIITSHAEELTIHPNGVRTMVLENARIKARQVAFDHEDAWVLGADTSVALGEKVFGKPLSMAEAKIMLRELSAKVHLVHTGICLINRKLSVEEVGVVTSEVYFKELNESMIEEYYREVDPLDKAGGYAIQTLSHLVVEKFEGSFSNVVGLPLELLKLWLSKYSILSTDPESDCPDALAKKGSST
jgi:septum formation protein